MDEAVLKFRRSGHFDAIRSQILADFIGTPEESRLKETIRSVMEAEALNHPVLLRGDQKDALAFLEKRVQKELSLLGSSVSKLPDFVDKYIDNATKAVEPKIEEFLAPAKHKQTMRPTYHPPTMRPTPSPSGSHNGYSSSTPNPRSFSGHNGSASKYDGRRSSGSHYSPGPNGIHKQSKPYRRQDRDKPRRRW